MTNVDSYTLFMGHAEVKFTDYVASNSGLLWVEIAWLKDFQSDKAKHLFRLFDEGKFGQAARYYNTNKF